MRAFNSLIGKIIALILTFVLGFLSCAGAIFGVGYIAYTKITLQDLVDRGWIDYDPANTFNPEAEVYLPTATIQQFVSEIITLWNLDSAVTLEVLMNRYGVTFVDGILDKIPEGALNVDLRVLFTAEGLVSILENTSTEYIFTYVPEGVLSEAAREKLKNKTLMDVVRLDLVYLLEGIEIGYFLGVNYELDEQSGEYIAVYADPEHPTLPELVAPLGISRVLEAVKNGEGLLSVVKNDIGGVMLESIFGAFMDLDSMAISSLIEGTPLADIIVEDENGVYVISIDALFADATIAKLMGYEPVYLYNDLGEPISDENGEPITFGFVDSEGNNVTGIARGLAFGGIAGLAEGVVDVGDLLSKAYLGDALGYVPNYDLEGNVIEWYALDYSGQRVEYSIVTDSLGNMKYASNCTTPVDSILKNAVGTAIGDLTNGDFNTGTLFDGIYVGEAMGYIAVQRVEGGELVFDYAFNKNGDPIYETDSDGNVIYNDLGEPSQVKYPVYDWYYDDNGQPGEKVSGANAIIADVNIGRLLDSDSGYEVSDVFDGTLGGHLLGYNAVDEDNDGVIDYWTKTTEKKDQNGNFVDENGDGNPDTEDIKLNGMDKGVANLDIGRLMNDPDYDLASAFNEVYFGELMGYYTLYEETFKQAFDENGDVILGEDLLPVLEFDGYVWYTNGPDGQKGTADDETVGVFEKKISNYKVGEILSGEVELTADSIIEDLTIADVLGYTSEEKTVSTKDGSVSATVTIWYNGTERLSGVIAAISDKKINEISSAIDNIYIYDVLGYVGVGAEWYAIEDDISNPGELVLAEKDGLILHLVDLSVTDLSDPDKVDGVIKSMQVGEVLGYEKRVALDGLGNIIYAVDENGDVIYDDNGDPVPEYEWYTLDDKGNGDPSDDEWVLASGVMKILSGKKVSELNNDIINDIAVKDVLNYRIATEDGIDSEGTEYYAGDLIDTNGKKVSGMMLALADVTISNLESKSYEIKLGQIMGFFAREEGYKLDELGQPIQSTDENGDPLFDENGDPVYEINYVWYEDSKYTIPAKGIIMYFADLTMNDMSNDEIVEATVQNILVADALGYTYDPVSGVWIDTDGNEVDGVMSLIIDKKVSEIDGVVKNMTVADILGYYHHTDSEGNVLDYSHWYEKVGGVEKPVTGVMAKLATAKINELNIEVHKLYFGDIEGYELCELTSGVYTPVDSVTMNEIINGAKNIDNYVWCDSVEISTDVFVYTPAAGLTLRFANLKIDDITNPEKLEEKVREIKISEALGYTRIEDDPSTPIVESGWTDRDGGKIDGILAAIAEYPIYDLDNAVNNITLYDMFGDKCNEGFLQLLDPATTLDALTDTNNPNSLTNVFMNKVFEDFITTGLVSFEPETIIALNQLDGFTEATYSFSGTKTEIVIAGVPTGRYYYNGVFYIDKDSDGAYTYKADEVVGWRACTINEIIPYILTKLGS